MGKGEIKKVGLNDHHYILGDAEPTDYEFPHYSDKHATFSLEYKYYQ